MNVTTARQTCWCFGATLLLVAATGCDRGQTSAAPVAAPTVTAAPPAPVQGEYYVEEAPPPPPPEVLVASPGPDFVWIGGYWGWNAGARVWVRGRWERPPRTHAMWVAPRWERRGRGYIFVNGFWR